MGGLTPHLTDQDIRKINQLYQCQDYASIKNTKNTKARLCYDDKSEDYCSEQKRQGYCWGTGETNAQIRFNCQKTCNQCGIKSFASQIFSSFSNLSLQLLGSVFTVIECCN